MQSGQGVPEGERQMTGYQRNYQVDGLRWKSYGAEKAARVIQALGLANGLINIHPPPCPSC